jgi:aminopeptidase N
MAPALFAYSQKKISYQYDPGAAMREHNLDFERMRLSVEFEPEKGLVKGKITHFFTPIRATVDSFFLDGPGITIKEAKLNGKDIKYKTNADGISFFPEKSLTWGAKDSLAITYEAYPRKGIYFIGWNDPNNISRKQIWTQGQGIDNRNWFPCYDTPNDKLLTEVYVKFNKDYKVLSNGVKMAEKDNKDGTKTWHYKMNHPHQSYLVMLGIGKYEIKESKSKSGVPMYSWYYPEWKNRVEWTYKYNEKIFDYLENEIGVPYQWESYSQIPVQDFMFGAMENTTATLFGDFFEVDSRSYNDRNYVAVNAHELAHQWFGDFVSARSGNSHWLQESFATHYNTLAERECFGQDHFDWQRRQAGIAAINIQDKKSISHSETSSTLIYQKGSQVLEMLKYVVGREGYNKSVKRYLLAHKYENVDSDDLLNAFQDELGYGLEWFWDEWVYRGGEPIYNVTFDNFLQEDGKQISQFAVTQTQPVSDISGLFKMPIVFEVYYTDGTKDSKTEWIEKESHIAKISNPSNKKIDFVLFDPNSEIMKTVSFNKSFDMLKAQALRAPKMIDRYDAVVALRKYPAEQKRNILEEVFNKNTFHALKAEAASQLLEDKTPEGLNLVKKALTDPDVQVRKAMLISTRNIEPTLQQEYEKLLLDSSYQTIVTALEKMCITFPENTQKYLDITKGIEGTNGRNVICKWLEIAAAFNSDKKLVDQLVAYTSNSYEFLTRGNAMASLRKLNYADEKLINNCIDACLSSNGRLAGPATETIKYFSAQVQYKKMIADIIRNRNSKNWEKDILFKLL